MTQSRLFYRYIKDHIINDLVLNGLDHLLQHEASVGFVLLYFKSLSDEEDITRFSSKMLKFAHYSRDSPKICSLIEEVYAKSNKHQLPKVNQSLLPVVLEHIFTRESSDLVPIYISKSDEQSLLALSDILNLNLPHHLVLQE